MMFLFRILTAVSMLVMAVLVILAIVWLLNKGVQFAAERLGYEVGDFFSWLRSKLPNRKKSRK